MTDDLLSPISEPSSEPAAGPSPLPLRWPLHPNIGWAILWCVALVLWSQIPGGVVPLLALVAWGILSPGSIPATEEALTAHPVVQASIGAGLFVAHAIIFILALTLLRILAGRHWKREVALRLPAWHQPLVALLMFPGFVLLSGAAYYFIRTKLGVPSIKDAGLPGMEDMEKMFGAWPVPLAVFLIAVVPAFSEEFWCRAFLGRGLVGIHGYILGVGFTSLLFGAIHVDPAQGTMAACMGVVLHVCYLWTRSLWIPMLLHFLNNASAVLLLHVPAAALLDHDIGTGHAPLYLAAALVLALGGLALWLGRTRLLTPPGEPAWVPEHPGVQCPPPGSATRLVATAPPWWLWLLQMGALACLAAAAWQLTTQ